MLIKLGNLMDLLFDLSVNVFQCFLKVRTTFDAFLQYDGSSELKKLVCKTSFEYGVLYDPLIIITILIWPF